MNEAQTNLLDLQNLIYDACVRGQANPYGAHMSMIAEAAEVSVNWRGREWHI